MSEYTDILIDALEFEESSGPYYGKNGHIFDGISTDDITTNDGQIGQCIEFTDGAAKLRVLNADMDSFQIGTGSQSIEFWAYIDAIPASGFRGFYVTGGSNNSDEGINVALNAASDTVRVNLSNGTTRTIVDASSSVLSDATWHHIIAIVDRDLDEVRIYIDGTEEGSGSISGFSSDDIQSLNNLDINGDFTGPNTGIDGRLDHFRVYNDVLSTSQITYLYNSGDGRSYYELADQTEVYYPLTAGPSDTRGTVWANLTETGSPSYSSSGVALSGSSERLTSESKVFRNVGDETFCLWGTITVGTIGSAMGIAGQNNSQYSVQVLGSGTLRFRVNTSDGVKTADWGTALSASTEYFFYAYHDADSDVIGIAVDDGTPVTSATSAGVPVQAASNFTIGSIATSNHFDGTVKNVGFRRGALLSSAEETHFAGGGDFDTELELDYESNASARRVKVQAKAAQIGGSGTQDCYHLVIDHSSLPDELHDSDETSTAEVSGAASLRVSTDEAGTNMVPLKVKAFTPASGGGSVELWLNNGSTLDGTSGSDFYIWWLAAGSGKTLPPADHEYGSRAVFPSSVVLALLDDDYTDATSNGNDGTATGVSISTDEPFGVGSFDFDGSTGRIEIPDDASLDLEDDIYAEVSFKTDTDTGTFQGLFNKRLASSNNYSMAFEVTNNIGFNYFNASFKGATATFATYFSTGTWARVSGSMDYSSGSGLTATNLYHDAVSIGSDSTSGQPTANSDSFIVGNIENGTGVFNQFPFDGKIKALFIHNTIPSSDIRATLDNNQAAPGTFWDSTFGVTSPASSGETGAITDTGQGGDTFTSTMAAVSAISEGASAGESWASIIAAAAAIVEGAGAGDAFSAVVGAGETGALSDGATGGDAWSAVAASLASLSEGATATDVFAAVITGAAAGAITEGSQAGESFVAALSALTSISEGAVAGDSWSAKTGFNASITEGATAGEVLTYPSLGYITATISIYNAINGTINIKPE